MTFKCNRNTITTQINTLDTDTNERWLATAAELLQKSETETEKPKKRNLNVDTS